MLPPGMESEPTPPRTGKKRGRPKKIPMEGELPPLEQEIITSSQLSTIVRRVYLLSCVSAEDWYPGCVNSLLVLMNTERQELRWRKS